VDLVDELLDQRGGRGRGSELDLAQRPLVVLIGEVGFGEPARQERSDDECGDDRDVLPGEASARAGYR